jgi:small-conductance mechanosensitive channel
MEILSNVFVSWYPTLLTAIIFFILYVLAKKLLERQAKGMTDKTLIKSIFLFAIAFTGIISVILAIPMSSEQKGQLTSLIGIVLSAVLGLSSTTFIGNALAGIALKLRRSFKPGDYIKVNDVFGRVTEQGLFHTEIQTLDRDLTTLPNLSLATNSVKVTRQSGTIISVECSLGYDVNRLKIEEALIKGAKNSGLVEPFVHIISMGDFSVVYKVHGLLNDIKGILSAKSKLTASVLDALHEAEIEIVSPTFMNQRQVNDSIFIPEKSKTKIVNKQQERKLENIIFDKAKGAEDIEKKRTIVASLDEKIKNEGELLKAAESPEEKENIKNRIDKIKEQKNAIINVISKELSELDNKV